MIIKKKCQFKPSCSRRALAFFKKYSFNDALKYTNKHLQICNGKYSIRKVKNGKIEMVCSNGVCFKDDEIADWIKARFRS